MSLRLNLAMGLTFAAILGLYAEPGHPLRVAAMLPFLLVAPGLAWVATSDRVGRVGYGALIVSLSIALVTLIATTQLFTAFWSLELGFSVLVLFVAVGLLATDA